MTDQRKAIDLLEEALHVLRERDALYGSAAVHYEELAKLNGAFFLREPTAKDMALHNVIEKLDRIRRVDVDSDTFRDSILDAINYLAIAWECS